MNGKYIVKLPIKDRKGTILGYEIMYNGEQEAYGMDGGENEFAAADTIYHVLTQNSEKLGRDSLNFMTFTTTLLLKKTPKLFAQDQLVIQIDDSVIINPLAMHFVQQFSKIGYQIAVNEFQFAPRYLALLDHIDYIKINAETTPEANMKNIIEIGHSMQKKCVVTGLKNDEMLQKALDLGADAVEGPIVAENLTTKVNNSSYLQSNFFRLMVAVTREDPNIDEIEQLIAMDAGLTYGLLKMVNSAYFALRSETTDIHQAVVMLGLEQLKQWIYLLSVSDTDQTMDAGTEEFLKRSFMRASFCSELMRHCGNMPISRSEAYLMGMFSMLNHLIDAPMEEILAEVPVSQEVKKALLTKEGRCGTLYKLVLSYETADWSAISSYAKELGIPDQMITNTYFNCVESVNALWEQLNHSSVKS